jgi:hypothetical protein
MTFCRDTILFLARNLDVFLLCRSEFFVVHYCRSSIRHASSSKLVKFCHLHTLVCSTRLFSMFFSAQLPTVLLQRPIPRFVLIALVMILLLIFNEEYYSNE